MKFFKNLKIVIMSMTLLGCISVPAARAEVQTVPSVDLSAYLGIWYEIAAIPQRFQKQCIGNTHADYSEGEGGTIKVINSCDTANAGRSSVEGRARAVDPASNAKLKVTFVRILGKWAYFFGGAYWIIDLQQNYDYAVVGHPNRTYGWILSRTPSLDAESLKKIATNLTAQGYDLCTLKMTRQEGGFSGGDTRLCDYVPALE